MAKNKKNEELQSRREFFKKAAKGALPILGAIVLSSVPNIVQAEEAPVGCRYGCGTCTGCAGGCKGTCHYGCDSSCKTGCSGTCRNLCVAKQYGR